MGLENVNNVVLVLSGKGGVGKSSVTIQLALSLTRQGHNVGILDIDLTGPSIPRLLNLEDKKVRQAPGGWLPVKVHDAVIQQQPPQVSSSIAAGGVQVPLGEVAYGATNTQHSVTSKQTRGSLHALSLAFLLPSRSSAVIWRGPKKTAMIRQFVSDVLWPTGTDYLLIDTPPGTSDEHIAIVEELHKVAVSTSAGGRLAGAVVVTTPQAISTSDVRKELNFCVKTQVPVLGVIENMAGFMCPCCNEISNVFSKGGGEIMARECDVPFLGSVPIDTDFGSLVEGAEPEADDVGPERDEDGDDGVPKPKKLLVEAYEQCGLYPIFEDFAKKVVLSVKNQTNGST